MTRPVIDNIDCNFEIDGVKPLRDYILVQVWKRGMTANGIILTEKFLGTPCSLGKVLRVGRCIENPMSAEDFPMDIEPGDVVLTMDYMGEKMHLREGTHRLVRTHGIWAKVKANPVTYEISEIEPRMSCVIVRPKNEEKSKGGVVLPKGQDSEWKNRWATVVKVGPGVMHTKSRKRIAPEVSLGDEVLMTRYAGAEVQVGGEWLRIIDESDIHCVKKD